MRKVSVGLIADVADFIKGMIGAKRSVDDLGDKVDKLDHELDKTAEDAAKAGLALKMLGGDADAAARKVDDLGTKRTNLALLDQKISGTRTEVRKLAEEFEKTGNVEIFRKLGDAQGRLQSLRTIRKDLADSIEGGVADAAESPGWRDIAIRVGAAFAVPLLAAIGGALTAFAGAGVAGLGVLGAVLGDPQKFQFAWGQALSQIKSEFFDASKPFTNETLAALQSLGPTIASWHLDAIFKNAVQYEEPLVHGIEAFATGAVRGASALVDKGGPAVAALSDGMARLGVAAENALNSIASGAEGGAYALHDTISAVSALIEVFGKAVQGAENLYGYIHDHPVEAGIASAGMTVPLSIWTSFDNTTHHLATTEYGLKQAAEAAGHQFNLQGDDLTALSQKLNTATLSTDTLAAAMVNKLFTATMNLDQATLGVAESLTRVDETFEQNRKTLGKHADQLAINTKQGQSNREAVLAAVTANMSLYQAQVAAGMSAEDAAQAYDDNTAALEAQLKKAHLTQGEIDGLIGKYRGIPKKVDTAIAIEGLTRAIDDLDTTLRLINNLHDKTVTVRVKELGDLPKGQSRGGGIAHGGIRKAAEGLIVPPSDPGTLIMGEPVTGGEAYIPLKGISQSRAMSLAQVVGDNYGFSVSARPGGGWVPPSGGGGADSMPALRLIVQEPNGRVLVERVIEFNANRGRSDPATFFLP